jgi:hypothetical protein
MVMFFSKNVPPVLSAPRRGPPLQTQEASDQATIETLSWNGSSATE